MGVCISHEDARAAIQQKPDGKTRNQHVLLNYGINVPSGTLEDHNAPRSSGGCSSEESGLTLYVHYSGGEQHEMTVLRTETALALKMRLHEADPEHVAPPGVAVLTFGGLELGETDTFEDHHIEHGATLFLSFEAGFTVAVPDSKALASGLSGTFRAAVVWPTELAACMLRRIELSTDVSWHVYSVVDGSCEIFDQSDTVLAAGLRAAASLVPVLDDSNLLIDPIRCGDQINFKAYPAREGRGDWLCGKGGFQALLKDIHKEVCYATDGSKVIGVDNAEAYTWLVRSEAQCEHGDDPERLDTLETIRYGDRITLKLCDAKFPQRWLAGPELPEMMGMNRPDQFGVSPNPTTLGQVDIRAGIMGGAASRFCFEVCSVEQLIKHGCRNGEVEELPGKPVCHGDRLALRVCEGEDRAGFLCALEGGVTRELVAKSFASDLVVGPDGGFVGGDLIFTVQKGRGFA